MGVLLEMVEVLAKVVIDDKWYEPLTLTLTLIPQSLIHIGRL